MIDRLNIYYQRLSSYLKEVARFKKLHPRHYRLPQMIAFFWPWFYSLRFGASPLKDEIPWMTFSAIEFLKSEIKKNMRVFEYGSGGSTLFFANLGCEVHSVEHDAAWYNAVQAEIHRRRLYSCRIRLARPEPAPAGSAYSPDEPGSCLSDAPAFLDRSFREYVHAIDAYPDGYFDFVVIDGRARNSCFVNCVSKVRRGGFIVWDNTDRESYSRYVDAAHEGLEFIDFPGPSPYVDFFTRTSVWKKIS